MGGTAGHLRHPSSPFAAGVVISQHWGNAWKNQKGENKVRKSKSEAGWQRAWKIRSDRIKWGNERQHKFNSNYLSNRVVGRGGAGKRDDQSWCHAFVALTTRSLINKKCSFLCVLASYREKPYHCVCTRLYINSNCAFCTVIESSITFRKIIGICIKL